MVGTAQYLSPEQARGESVDARSDLYSTGCLLYELLTGQPPFQGDSAVAIAYQHVREIPKRPSSLAADVPESLDRVILKSLAKSREDRYQDAAHMRADLQAAVRGLSVAAPAADSWSPATSVMASPEAEPVQPTSTFAQVASGSSPMQAAKEAEEPEEKPKSHAWVWILVFLLFMALAVAGGLWASGAFDSHPTPTPSPTISKVEVPDTSGQDEESARKTIEGAGLKFAKDEVANEEVSAGLAVSSDPGKGTKVEPNSTVTVHFSTGSAMVKVPDLTGKTQEDARKALKDAGLEGGNTSQEDSATVAKDRVIYTNPPAGNSVARGTTVDLVLSTGNTSVPDVSGQDEATAKKTIEDAGLQFKKGDDVASAEVERGKAVSSDPAAGSSASSGDTITVHFSSGAATAAPTGPVTIPKNLNGKTVEEATAELQKLGLNVTVDYKSSDKVDANKVIGTSPKAGDQVPAGSTVNLTVSSGKDGGGGDNQQPGNPNPGGGGGGVN